jgi:hypothetical protein
MKVYCDNCEYFYSVFGFRPDNSKGRKPGQYNTKRCSPTENNWDNACIYYKKKWWKFWIRNRR